MLVLGSLGSGALWGSAGAGSAALCSGHLPGGSSAKEEAEQMKILGGASVQVPSNKMQLFVLWRATSPPSLEQSSCCKPAFILFAAFTKLASHLQFLNLECYFFWNSVPFDSSALKGMQVFVFHTVCHSSARTQCTLLLLLCPFEEQHFLNLVWDLLSSIIFCLCNLGKEGGLRALSEEFCRKLFLAQCPSPAMAQCVWRGQGEVGSCWAELWARAAEVPPVHGWVQRHELLWPRQGAPRSVLLPRLQLWDCCGSAVWVSQAAVTGIAEGRVFCYSTE